MQPDVVIVGAGIFGVTAALELVARGAKVRVLDPGPVPHPDASSTDISKLIRADYAGDELYAHAMLRAFPRWREWNDRFGATLFHETGVLVLARERMEPGGFEHESHALLSRLDVPLQRLEPRDIEARFPAWAAGAYADGYYNPVAGWAESGRVVATLADEARRLGVEIREGCSIAPLDPSAPSVEALRTAHGERIEGGHFVIAAGAHTPLLLPELADRIRPIAQFVFHFEPADASLFSPPAFVPWAADIARSGWYGFASAAHAGGVVKVARHAEGFLSDPRAPREVPASVEPLFRAFLRESLPALADRPVVSRRVCFYSDSFDGDFFIDRHPRWSTVTVASGGSGHAFKFAPLLGEWIADAALGTAPAIDRFRFRALADARREAARAGS
ncbi:MAG: FAD-dependent oxidoreductase [Polyangiaceae bacterium]